MDIELQHKILKDKDQTKYLKEHSEWYKYLNRTPSNYKEFLNESKKHKRNQNMGKINNVIDTLDTVNTVFKIIN